MSEYPHRNTWKRRYFLVVYNFIELKQANIKIKLKIYSCVFTETHILTNLNQEMCMECMSFARYLKRKITQCWNRPPTKCMKNIVCEPYNMEGQIVRTIKDFLTTKDGELCVNQDEYLQVNKYSSEGKCITFTSIEKNI